MQSSAEGVDLRWDRVSEKQEDVFGLPSYHITRVDSQHAKPIPVTKLPVIIGELMGKTDHVEPMAFCHDHGVAPGPVTYQVSMIDMFGRESAGEALDVGGGQLAVLVLIEGLLGLRVVRAWSSAMNPRRWKR